MFVGKMIIEVFPRLDMDRNDIEVFPRLDIV
jgi:hypothetical protein